MSALYLEVNPSGCIAMTADSEGQGGGLPIGALDIVFLLLALAGVAILVSWYRRRKKKELVRKVTVPIA